MVMIGKLHCIALSHDDSQAQSDALPPIEGLALDKVFRSTSLGCLCSSLHSSVMSHKLQQTTMDKVLSTQQHGMMASWPHAYVTCRRIQQGYVLAPETCCAAAQTFLETSNLRWGSWGMEECLQRLLLLQHSTATIAATTSTSSGLAGLLSCPKLLIGPEAAHWVDGKQANAISKNMWLT